MTIAKDKIWVVLPAFNEEKVIDHVIKRIQKEGFKNILVIDDGSTDDTFKMARNAGVYAQRFCLNRGVGAVVQGALLFGRRKSIEYMVLLDADGQHYPEDIEKLKQTMENEKADLVIGSRFLDDSSSIPTSRRVFNKIGNALTILGRTVVTDSQSGFRLLNKHAIHKLNLKLDGYGVCTEMIWKAKKSNLKFIETPIRVAYTEYSLSKGQNFWVGIRTAFNLLKNLIN